MLSSGVAVSSVVWTKLSMCIAHVVLQFKASNVFMSTSRKLHTCVGLANQVLAQVIAKHT